MDSAQSSSSAMSSTSPRCHIRNMLELRKRIQSLVDCDGSLILHHRKWRCLASSYSLVLDAVTRRVEHACFLLASSEQQILSHRLSGSLEALYHAMQEGERCLEDCSIRNSDVHMWLVDKALKLGISTDVVDLHLHDLVWCYFVIEEALRDTAHLHDSMHVLEEEVRRLGEIWAEIEGAGDDTSSVLEFLAAVAGKEEGDLSSLADFIWHQLSRASDLEGLATSDDLPAYLWVDPEELETDQGNAIGEGSFGRVFVTKWLGGRFAVKDFFYVEDETKFGREAAIQASLRHPNVIHLVCCIKNPALNKCSLVMQLMRQDLRGLMIDRMKSGLNPPFSLLTSVDLMLQIAKGMEYLHSLHIIHRDLRSANILVSFPTGLDAHLKVADFGMSKAKHASSKYTTKQTGATPWRAPEVFGTSAEEELKGGPNGKYRKKADVYSFGLVCYEILTGQFPYEGLPKGQIHGRVMKGERPKLPLDSCPLALASFIEKCWDGEPSVRPTFTQICIMLRYFKASVLINHTPLHHHDRSSAGHEWLSCALSSGMLARIEDMISELSSKDAGVLLRPRQLSIPLEMHCCRIVLQGAGEVQSSMPRGCGSPKDDEMICIAQTLDIDPERANRGNSAVQISMPPHVLQEGQVKSRATCGIIHMDPVSRKSDGFFTATSRKLKQLFNGIQRTQYSVRMTGNFTYKDLAAATRSFSKLIHQGGSAKAFLGKLADGQDIAVKHFKLKDADMERILARVMMACSIHHRHLVQMLGWCKDEGNLLLVYKLVPNGSLDGHISGEQGSVLAWDQRYRVVFELATALNYLHQEQIVHGDVRPCNVLLDLELHAQLAGLDPCAEMQSVAAETLELELAPSSALDVYSFGMTVLQVTCGLALLPSTLRNWVRELYDNDDLINAGDIRLLAGGFDRFYEEAEMRQLLLLGLSCTEEHPDRRPTMRKVLQILSEPPSP